MNFDDAVPLGVAGGEKPVIVNRGLLWAVEDLLLRARDGRFDPQEVTRLAAEVRRIFVASGEQPFKVYVVTSGQDDDVAAVYAREADADSALQGQLGAIEEGEYPGNVQVVELR